MSQYLPVVVFGALLFDRQGAYSTAGVASAGFGVAILAAGSLLPEAMGRMPGELAFALWGVHTGAMLLVALFASGLARELRIAGVRLEESATDLAELRSLHERTVESLTSGVLTTDGQDRITSFNPGAERITGRRCSEVIGRPLLEVLPGIEGVGALEVGLGSARARFRFENAVGEERFLGMAISELRSGSEGRGGRVVIFQDVTEVVRLEAELARNARLAGIGELSASIAHEIRNPLAAISGAVEMLRSTLDAEVAEGESGRLMEIALREIDRLNQLITDFLRYARPTPTLPVRCDLAALAREVGTAFRAGLGPEAELRLEVGEQVWVDGDSKQLRQMLWNLLGNAREALPERGGCIRLWVRPVAWPQEGAGADRKGAEGGEDLVELGVADTGVGIDAALLDRIFDPFFTTRSKGTGLGLATVHRIVENHGGKVHVCSAPGLGTTFRIRFGASGGESAEP